MSLLASDILFFFISSFSKCHWVFDGVLDAGLHSGNVNKEGQQLKGAEGCGGERTNQKPRCCFPAVILLPWVFWSYSRSHSATFTSTGVIQGLDERSILIWAWLQSPGPVHQPANQIAVHSKSSRQKTVVSYIVRHELYQCTLFFSLSAVVCHNNCINDCFALFQRGKKTNTIFFKPFFLAVSSACGDVCREPLSEAIQPLKEHCRPPVPSSRWRHCFFFFIPSSRHWIISLISSECVRLYRRQSCCSGLPGLLVLFWFNTFFSNQLYMDYVLFLQSSCALQTSGCFCVCVFAFTKRLGCLDLFFCFLFLLHESFKNVASGWERSWLYKLWSEVHVSFISRILPVNKEKLITSKRL